VGINKEASKGDVDPKALIDIPLTMDGNITPAGKVFFKKSLLFMKSFSGVLGIRLIEIQIGP
jgi:hypothetical protein